MAVQQDSGTVPPLAHVTFMEHSGSSSTTDIRYGVLLFAVSTVSLVVAILPVPQAAIAVNCIVCAYPAITCLTPIAQSTPLPSWLALWWLVFALSAVLDCAMPPHVLNAYWLLKLWAMLALQHSHWQWHSGAHAHYTAHKHRGSTRSHSRTKSTSRVHRGQHEHEHERRAGHPCNSASCRRRQRMHKQCSSVHAGSTAKDGLTTATTGTGHKEHMHDTPAAAATTSANVMHSMYGVATAHDALNTAHCQTAVPSATSMHGVATAYDGLTTAAAHDYETSVPNASSMYGVATAYDDLSTAAHWDKSTGGMASVLGVATCADGLSTAAVDYGHSCHSMYNETTARDALGTATESTETVTLDND